MLAIWAIHSDHLSVIVPQATQLSSTALEPETGMVSQPQLGQA
jgi:hypothetical protein